MKFDIVVGGLETKFPEFEVHYLKEKNKIIIYVLKNNDIEINIIENNIKKNPKLKFENSFLILNIGDFQYGFDLEEYSVLEMYQSGTLLGFAFQDIDGKMLDIETPTFYQ